MEYFYGAALVAFMGLQTKEEKNDVTAFYSKYRKMALHYAMKLSNGHEANAEDAVQETFADIITVWEAFSDFTDEIQKRRLLAITRNKVANIYNKERADKHVGNYDTESIPDEEIDIELDYIDNERCEIAAVLVAQLPPKCKAVVQMRYDLGMTNGEIAEKLGIAPSTVSTHLKQAKKMLNKYIKDELL